MAVKKGTLSIDSENIFPIIKKWVYSDHDIFVREMVSNGCDAITKLKKLDMMGEYELPEGYKPKIEVIVNPEEKTMKFIDNGLGMTAEEVEEYITQIAFSGATQFLEKYKDKTTEDDMIGHFGLGFYSAFMVADEVQIDTLSYKEGAAPVHWASQGGTEYEMQEGNKTTVGSEITLFLNEDRHMHNIAVLRDGTGGYHYCPVFDNGCALLSDTQMDYPMGEDIITLIPQVRAKTLSRNFMEQLEAVEALYGQSLKFSYSIKEIEMLLEKEPYYPEEIKIRVRDILLQQRRTYQYLFR